MRNASIAKVYGLEKANPRAFDAYCMGTLSHRDACIMQHIHQELVPGKTTVDMEEPRKATNVCVISKRCKKRPGKLRRPKQVCEIAANPVAMES